MPLFRYCYAAFAIDLRHIFATLRLALSLFLYAMPFMDMPRRRYYYDAMMPILLLDAPVAAYCHIRY